MICSWCGGGPVRRHYDPEKAHKGYTVCSACNMVHSPEAAIKGTFGYWDPENAVFVTGIRKESTNESKAQ